MEGSGARLRWRLTTQFGVFVAFILLMVLSGLAALILLIALADRVVAPAPERPAGTERGGETAPLRYDRSAREEMDALFRETPEGHVPSVRDEWATALHGIPGVGHAEWRDDTLNVFVDFRGGGEEFELLALRLCHGLVQVGVRGVYVALLDHEFAKLGVTKTRQHMFCP